MSSWSLVLGRLLYGACLIAWGLALFSAEGIAAAPWAGGPQSALVLGPAAGLLAVAGGLSVALGYRARAGAWLAAVSLAPRCLWEALSVPAGAGVQERLLLSLALLGATLVIAGLGAGPGSLDERRERRRLERLTAARRR